MPCRSVGGAPFRRSPPATLPELGWRLKETGRPAGRHSIRRRRTGPLTAVSGPPWWAVALVAITGAWIGHFLEYVRVSGWHTATSEMSSSVHLYFFPAGVALMAVLAGCGVLARRAWTRLGRRLHRAEMALRRPIGPQLVVPVAPAPARGSIVSLWAVLTVLQLGAWTIQENLETVAAGHSAPLWGVLGGVHLLAPVVQAEVALILAVVYRLGRWCFHRREARVVALERIVARRWSLRPVSCPPPVETCVVWAPLDRWGAQRWNRPPPHARVHLRTSG